MDVRRVEDPAAFLADAAPLLLADEARHNLMLGIAGTLRDHPLYYPDYGLWLAQDGSSRSSVSSLRLQSPARCARRESKIGRCSSTGGGPSRRRRSARRRTMSLSPA